MDISCYEKNQSYGRMILVGGVIMCFERIKLFNYIGFLMIIISIIIINYYQTKINKIITNFNNNIINFIEEDNISEDVKEQEKELNIIKTFERKYNLINHLIINNQIIINNQMINNNEFFDIYLFVSKLKIVIDLKLINNKLLLEYYEYYNNIISYISNLETISEISITVSDLIDDYYDNSKQLYKLFNISESNKNNRYINNISDILDKMIDDHLINKLNKN
uniref:Uncharacterized protein n=1 Tax=viral metagenome TaxID=1070528 RepID=A0A6C0HVV5_9ZZZZ